DSVEALRNASGEVDHRSHERTDADPRDPGLRPRLPAEAAERQTADQTRPPRPRRRPRPWPRWRGAPRVLDPGHRNGAGHRCRDRTGRPRLDPARPLTAGHAGVDGYADD